MSKKKLPYSAWARMDMAWISDNEKQLYRHNWFSDSGKAKKYDLYREYAKLKGMDYDNPPDNYWEEKDRPWHGAAGAVMGLTGVLAWFLTQLIAGSTGQKGK